MDYHSTETGEQVKNYPSQERDVGIPIYCSRCGYQVQGGGKYCTMCGWEVQALSAKHPQDIRVGAYEAGSMRNQKNKSSLMSKKSDIIETIIAIISIFLYIVGFGIHIWTVSIAMHFIGFNGGFLISCIPVVGELYWIYQCYGASGTFLNLYTTVILLYIIFWIVHIAVGLRILPDEKEKDPGGASLGD